jgi:hypothetical protein
MTTAEALLSLAGAIENVAELLREAPQADRSRIEAADRSRI